MKVRRIEYERDGSYRITLEDGSVLHKAHLVGVKIEATRAGRGDQGIEVRDVEFKAVKAVKSAGNLG